MLEYVVIRDARGNKLFSKRYNLQFSHLSLFHIHLHLCHRRNKSNHIRSSHSLPFVVLIDQEISELWLLIVFEEFTRVIESVLLNASSSSNCFLWVGTFSSLFVFQDGLKSVTTLLKHPFYLISCKMLFVKQRYFDWCLMYRLLLKN